MIFFYFAEKLYLLDTKCNVVCLIDNNLFIFVDQKTNFQENIRKGDEWFACC